MKMFVNKKILKFLGAGILNTLFGYSVFAALVFLEIPNLLALLISTIFGVAFNYFSFGFMVFKGIGGWLGFAKFVSVYILIYAVNANMLKIITVKFFLNPYFGQAICLPISVALSWLLMNYWVYKND